MDSYYGGIAMNFKSFKLEQNDMSARRYVYEGHKTDNGVHLEHYIRTEEWDDKKLENVECRSIVRAIDGDIKLFHRLCDLFDNCGVGRWADFHGRNLYALDGAGMNFDVVLEDGTKLNAEGNNEFPPNYSKLVQGLRDLITTEKISSTKFTDGTYEITLPEKWVGVVKANFSEGLVSFDIDKTDGGELTFFIIDNNEYGYSSDSYKGRIEAGRLISNGKVRFITARDNYSIALYAGKVSGEALAIWENYEKDKLAIIESICGINGYEFYPEDGKTLYLAKAMELADKARSLWLSLNFAGDYPGGAKPVRLNRQNYVPMFPPYFYINTMEDVRKKFLAVFSEEFTEKTLNRAVAAKELIEYKDDIYVACKKCKGDASYNSWVKSVRDDGNGKFVIVIAVIMPPGSNKIYVELPTEKNSAGEYVITDYPYWDESE